MAKKVINVGTTANDSTGDSLRVAGVKINDNFTELYNALGGETGAPLSIVSKILPGNGIAVSAPTGDVLITAKTASAGEIGGIRIGQGISINEQGVASVQVYELPRASQTILGGIKVGDRLSIDGNGVLSADPGAYTLPRASDTVLGGIRVGTGLVINGSGVLSVEFGQYSLPTATSTVLGGVKVGARLSINDGVLSADVQTVGISDRLTASDKTLILDTSGRISYPGNSVHQQTNLVSILPNANTVIYSTNGNYVRAIKIFALVEKFTNGYEIQACDVVATIDETTNQVYVSVYGVTYSGDASIATFDGQYNSQDLTYEITARPVSTIDTLNVRVQITELNGTD